MNTCHGRLLGVSLAVTLLPAPWATAAPRAKGGEIMTRDQFKYGAFEARLRAAAGSGLLTPFFLLRDGTEIPGTPWQEMDIEVFGKEGGYGYQTQLITPGQPRTQHLREARAATSLTGSYHTYRLEWTPTRLAFYLDGRLVRDERDTGAYRQIMDPHLAAPMRLRVSAWAQNDVWSGLLDWRALPAHAFVKYVQVERYVSHGIGRGRFRVLWRDDFSQLDRQRWVPQTSPGPLTGMTDFTPGNVQVRNGHAILTVTP